jgi:hypothetical protein
MPAIVVEVCNRRVVVVLLVACHLLPAVHVLDVLDRADELLGGDAARIVGEMRLGPAERLVGDVFAQ